MEPIGPNQSNRTANFARMDVPNCSVSNENRKTWSCHWNLQALSDTWQKETILFPINLNSSTAHKTHVSFHYTSGTWFKINVFNVFVRGWENEVTFKSDNPFSVNPFNTDKSIKVIALFYLGQNVSLQPRDSMLQGLHRKLLVQWMNPWLSRKINFSLTFPDFMLWIGFNSGTSLLSHELIASYGKYCQEDLRILAIHEAKYSTSGYFVR